MSWKSVLSVNVCSNADGSSRSCELRRSQSDFDANALVEDAAEVALVPSEDSFHACRCRGSAASQLMHKCGPARRIGQRTVHKESV